MTSFDSTNLGLKLMEQEVVLLLAAAVLKLGEIQKHPVVAPARKKTALKEGTKLMSMYMDSARYREVVESGAVKQFPVDVAPVLKNVVVRKAEDHDEP